MRSWLKLLFRTLRDRRTRGRLRDAGDAGDTQGPRVVMASTWDFPNPTHGYAYQEMLGYLAAGYDLRVFFGDDGPTAGLAERYRPLFARRVRVETVRSIHERDLAALDRAHPGAVDRFLARVAAATGRDVVDLREDSTVLRAATFARLCELWGARCLQSWFCYDQSFLAMFAAEVLGLPRVLSCHVDHVLQDHPFKLVGLHLATADLVTAISERTRDELVGIGGPECRERILVKRIGVDGTAYRALRGRRRPHEPFTLVSLCRLEPKKGLLELLDALAELLRHGPRVRLRLIGGEDPGHPASRDYAAAVRQRIAALGLAAHVAMEGAIPNDAVAGVFAAADAFVAPYVEVANGDKDGIPTAMVEAMAAGLPIVCTDAGAITEAVQHEVEGLVVPQRDPAALAAAFERLAGSPELQQRLGDAAAARFDREFDAATVDRELHRRVRAMLG